MFKNALVYLSSSVVSSAIVFLVSVYAARNLTVDEYGMLGLFLAIIYFIKPVGVFCSAELVAVMKNKVNEKKFQNFSNSYISLSILILIFLQLLAILLTSVINNYYLLIMLTPILIFIMNLNDFHNRELIQKFNSVKYGNYLVITRIVFALFFILLENFDFGLSAYIVSLLMADLIVLLIRLRVGFATLVNFSFSLKKEGLLKIMKYGEPLFVALFFGWLLNQSDRFIILNFFSLSSVATYTVGYSVGAIINTINMSAVNAITPIVYNHIKKEGEFLYLMKITILYALFLLFICIIVGQRIIGPAMAKKFGVKLVMYGENQAEYGNSIEENTNPIMNMDFFSSDDALSMKFGGVSMQEYIDTGKYTRDDFAPYIAPDKKDLIDNGIEVHYLGYYLKWDPQECYYYSVENTGFQANPVRTEGTYSKYSSIDDKIDPFHYFTTLIKFGIGRCTYDAAQEVRNDKITREEARYLVEKYDTEFPDIYFKDFLEYIDTTEDEFWKVIDKHRSPHIWRKVDKEWMLRHIVSNTGTDD